MDLHVPKGPCPSAALEAESGKLLRMETRLQGCLFITVVYYSTIRDQGDSRRLASAAVDRVSRHQLFIFHCDHDAMLEGDRAAVVLASHPSGFRTCVRAGGLTYKTDSHMETYRDEESLVSGCFDTRIAPGQ